MRNPVTIWYTGSSGEPILIWKPVCIWKPIDAPLASGDATFRGV